MKKTAFALMVILAFSISLMVGTHFVSLVGANGYLYRMGMEHIEPLPGTSPPEIVILNPKNYTTYSNGVLNVTIHATRPITQFAARFVPLQVNYFLDGLHKDTEFYDYPHYEVELNTSLSDMRSGSHELVVQAKYYVESGNAVFTIDSNSTVFFTVENTSASPSPSPSPLFIATPELIPTPTPESESLPPSLVMASSVTVAVVLVGIGLLLYGIKRK